MPHSCYLWFLFCHSQHKERFVLLIMHEDVRLSSEFSRSFCSCITNYCWCCRSQTVLRAEWSVSAGTVKIRSCSFQRSTVDKIDMWGTGLQELYSEITSVTHYVLVLCTVFDMVSVSHQFPIFTNSIDTEQHLRCQEFVTNSIKCIVFTVPQFPTW